MFFFRKNKSLLSGICILLLLIGGRMIYTNTFHFAFLIWNLFLALVPLYFSHLIKLASKPYMACCWALLWLVFFPNAAYLLTDITHLRKSVYLIYWLDMIILYLAGIYGLFIGMLSLQEMEGWYGRYVTVKAKHLITVFLLLLCGYGIYLGRVERWNSWDVVAQPHDLLSAVIGHSRHPFRNKEVWIMTALFGTGLGMLYNLFIRVLRKAF